MSYWKFLLYTTIGAASWHTILALLGHYMHSFVPEDQLQEKILEYGEYIKFSLISLVIVVCFYFLVKWYVKKKKNNKNHSQQV